MRVKHFLIFTGFLGWCLTGFTQKINIGLYNESLLKAVAVNIKQGQYVLTDSSGFSLNANPNTAYFFTIKNDSILVFSENKFIGANKTVYLIPVSDECFFSVKPTEPLLSRKTFDDGLKILVKWGVLQLVNKTDIDKYVSGVVEAEGGPRCQSEYYKSQALL